MKSVEDAVALFAELRKEGGDSLSAFEIISRTALELVLKNIPDTRDPFAEKYPYYILAVFSTSSELIPLRETTEKLLEKKLTEGLIPDALLAESVAQAKSFWHVREHVSEAAKKEGRGVHFDISVPISGIPEFIRTVNPEIANAVPEAIILPFGHIGDGNIHYNICLPKTWDDAKFESAKDTMKKSVYAALKRLHGSISAEHGIGVERREDLKEFKSKEEITMMKALKKALDPKGIMNPGKML